MEVKQLSDERWQAEYTDIDGHTFSSGPWKYCADAINDVIRKMIESYTDLLVEAKSAHLEGIEILKAQGSSAYILAETDGFWALIKRRVMESMK